MPQPESIQSLEDLRQRMGPITPGEQRHIASINLSAPLTAEEEAALGPDFTKRVIDNVMQSINK